MAESGGGISPRMGAVYTCPGAFAGGLSPALCLFTHNLCDFAEISVGVENFRDFRKKPFKNRVQSAIMNVASYWKQNEVKPLDYISYELEQTRQALLEAGVVMMDPSTVYVEAGVRVGSGTILLPGTILRGDTTIGVACEIGPNTMLTDCQVGDGVHINSSQCSGSTIEDGAQVGPFAYIRPGCRVGQMVKVGDFVELKNSTIGPGTKLSHLTYVGDSDVGADCNFGCGTVTCNYDGATKSRTVIQNGVFVGCNTNFVPPVTVGEGAYIGAGTTVTDDVPPGALALGRVRQECRTEWKDKRK